MGLQVVILAAGKGTRMRSSLPKVMHQLGGVSLLERVVKTAEALSPESIHVVYGHQGDRLKQVFSHLNVNWVLQEQQLGTGHAVMQVLPHINNPSDRLLILSADVPLIELETLSRLVTVEERQVFSLLTASFDDPKGLGRVIRGSLGEVAGIIEEKDANEPQRAIREIYSGIMLISLDLLHELVPKLDTNNAQQEYYLTELIALAVQANFPVSSHLVDDPWQVMGINDRSQLQQMERRLQFLQAEKLLLSGVSLIDAERIDIRGELTCEQDVCIDINVVFEGKVTIAAGSSIGPGCVIKNCQIGPGVEILAHSVLEGSTVGADCVIGPFARLRPGTQLADNCKVGNFVEIKKSVIDSGSKVNHLSYVGDALIGKAVNVGAGTITCNYDGVNKHQTIIEDEAFIGSDTQLVAPVTVGKAATIGAGTTVRRDAPAAQLTLNDTKQKVIEKWQRPQKKQKNPQNGE